MGRPMGWKMGRSAESGVPIAIGRTLGLCDFSWRSQAHMAALTDIDVRLRLLVPVVTISAVSGAESP